MNTIEQQITSQLQDLQYNVTGTYPIITIYKIDKQKIKLLPKIANYNIAEKSYTMFHGALRLNNKEKAELIELFEKFQRVIR